MADHQEISSVQKKDRIKSRTNLNLIVLTISLSSFYFGYTLACMIQIQTDTLQHLYSIPISTSLTEGILNGAIPLGALIGAFASSYFISHFQRKNLILLANGLAIILGILIFIKNFYLLVVVRLLQGLCVGYYSSIVPLLIKEISPTQISGTLGSYNQILISLGFFFSCAFAYLLNFLYDDRTGESSWRFVLGFPLLTLALQTFLLIFVFRYDTPKYLLQLARENDARALLEVIYQPQYIEQVLRQKKEDVEASRPYKLIGQVGPQGEGVKTNLPKFLSIYLSISQQFTGSNAVAIYAASIAGAAIKSLADIMPTLINFQQLVFAYLSSFLLAKVGRKIILEGGAIFLSIACCTIAVGFFLKESESSLGKVFIIIGLFIFMATFSISLGPVIWLYIPEIVQPNFVPYSTAVNWLCAFLITSLFPIITDNILGGNPGLLFLFFAVWTLVAFILIIRYVIETKDKTQKQIIREYNQF